MKEKVIPHSIEAEQAVLGSMFLTKYAMQKSIESLNENLFYLDSHAKIFSCIRDLSEENKYQYYVSTSNTELVGGSWRNYTSGETFTIAKATGRYYLWIYPISDIEGKIADSQTDINVPYVKKEVVISNVISYVYSGQEEEFIVPSTGYYKLETWGAQGGSSTEFVSAIEYY